MATKECCYCGESHDILSAGERIDGRQVFVCHTCMEEYISDPCITVNDREFDDEEFDLVVDRLAGELAQLRQAENEDEYDIMYDQIRGVRDYRRMAR